MATSSATQTTTDFTEAFGKLKARSLLMRSESLKARVQRLRSLESWLWSHQQELERAVFEDLGKPAMEVCTSELFPVLSEINHTLKHLKSWAEPSYVSTPITFLGTAAEIRREPKGTCLIISPWNYPFNLAIGPLVSCLAAGNNAVIKPSELTPHTSAFIERLVKEVFTEDVVVIAQGDADVSTALLKLPFDHIFFTGSPNVGKIVMRAAAERLASVTLELGGKSPAIIDRSANLKDAAKRIAFGKFINNGQTCIAPDYIVIEESIREQFISLLKDQVSELFGKGEKVNEGSNDYARIVSSKHFERLNNLVKDAVSKGATLTLTGEVNAATKFFPPMIVTDVTNDMLVMQEEIFGPVLPVVSVSSIDQSIQIVNDKPKPLSLYVFSNNEKWRERVLHETSAGGVCINDCVLQFIHPNLPFGGVNNSGIGKAHGKEGFLAFSNEKPVVFQKRGYSTANLFYPPYTGVKRKLVDFILRWLA